MAGAYPCCLSNERLTCVLPGRVVRVCPDEVDIAHVGAAKEIHKVGGRYLKAGFYTHIGHRSAKTLFSTTDPKFHAVRRRLLSSPMSESSLAQFEPIVADRVRLCMTRMSEEMKSRGVADVFKWWTFFATDTIGELSFGESFRMLEYGKVNSSPVSQRKVLLNPWATEKPVHLRS